MPRHFEGPELERLTGVDDLMPDGKAITGFSEHRQWPVQEPHKVARKEVRKV